MQNLGDKNTKEDELTARLLRAARVGNEPTPLVEGLPIGVGGMVPLPDVVTEQCVEALAARAGGSEKGDNQVGASAAFLALCARARERVNPAGAASRPGVGAPNTESEARTESSVHGLPCSTATSREGTQSTCTGNNALSGCTSLSSIYIPECVTSHETGAIPGCSGLTSITIPESVPSSEGVCGEQPTASWMQAEGAEHPQTERSARTTAGAGAVVGTMARLHIGSDARQSGNGVVAQEDNTRVGEPRGPTTR